MLASPQMVLPISLLFVHSGGNLVRENPTTSTVILKDLCSIIGSLAGTSYFGPTASHGFLNHNLNELREERLKHPFNKRGLIQGNVEAVPAPPESDHYTRVHKLKADHTKH